MKESYIPFIAQQTNITVKSAENTIKLLSEGATVAFIARYRKEWTGELNETQIQSVADQYKKCEELEKRKETILETIKEQDKLTDELQSKIDSTWVSIELEDLYLPYKPKRKTLAFKAREAGLEPLAGLIMKQFENDLEYKAQRFICNEYNFVEDVLKGAGYIIAEWVNERTTARNTLRKLFGNHGIIESKLVKGKEEEGKNYRDYFSFSERIKHIAAHRVLALFRAEKEGILRVKIAPSTEFALERLQRIFVKGNTESSLFVKACLSDAYRRLLQPSLEIEFKNELKVKADESSIEVFKKNLEQLLLASPLGPKKILALDPGFRTGCKLVCLNQSGELVFNTAIFPHPPINKTSEATEIIQSCISKYKIEAIAVGNGTAGRETQTFLKKYCNLNGLEVFMVNEAGASIYSASEIAREEFPNQDITVRGAVSIGRRLLDPLSELVKIDPKSIGVGQYQHDVNQKQLNESLTQMVESCVNRIGVNLNTASEYLLRYVSGLTKKTAKKIIDYRRVNGKIKSRTELLKVSGLGAKAYEQCAGFLRITDGTNPLDQSSVHPERYSLVKQMAESINLPLDQILFNESNIRKIDINKFVDNKIGLPTLKDILKELNKPGLDPRGEAQSLQFSENITSIEDLKSGMKLPGIVSNITNFGAFIDIGIKEGGMVHVSQLANRFVKDPNEVVNLGQHVLVKVLEVDLQRKRISLTMKDA